MKSRPMLGVLFSLAFAGPLLAAGAPPRPGYEETWHLRGCGKAASQRARFATKQMQAREAGVPRGAPVTGTDVLHYDLAIEITNLNTGGNTCTITGTNAMTIQSLGDGLTEFEFRLREQYNITSADVGGVPISVAEVSTTTRIATLDRAYNAGEVFTLTVAYTGGSVSRGFGSIEVDTQFGTPVVTTLSEPYFAYTWWPCKDGDTFLPGDHSDKATVDFSITAPNNYVVPSNGLLQSVDSLSGNRKRYNWSSNYPIATYLLSFAATNYVKWEQTYTYPGGTMPVEFYIYPGNNSAGNRAAWEECIDMLAAFRPLYGEYPFIDEKYGIYNFNFGGGMEHQTITGQGTFSESVTAHELAHQWWGDMITCKSWSHIWLNEGFATYGECLWEENKSGSPDPAAYQAAMLDRHPVILGAGSTVYIPPEDTADINRIFDYNYSYLKGCWVLHQLRHVVGDATFFDILADYRAAFEFSAAETDDFKAVAEATSGMSLGWFFDEWVYNPGIPSYQYGWQSTSVAGQNYLLLRINQSQLASIQTITMPVDVRATIGGVPQTLVVWNDARTEWFVVPVSAPVTAVELDPDTWILRSTLTSQAYVAGPPKIVQTAPMPGEQVENAASPSQLSVWFHTNVNASIGAFTLVGANTGAHALSLVSGANVNPVVLNLAGPLPADEYTLTITTGTVTAVNSGMSLDGEVSDPASPASLPSGNGLAGGVATIQFSVAPVAIGDIDADGDTDGADLLLLVDVLLGIDLDPDHVLRSDIDESGTPNGDDIQPFLDAYPGL